MKRFIILYILIHYIFCCSAQSNYFNQKVEINTATIKDKDFFNKIDSILNLYPESKQHKKYSITFYPQTFQEFLQKDHEEYLFPKNRSQYMDLDIDSMFILVSPNTFNTNNMLYTSYKGIGYILTPNANKKFVVRNNTKKSLTRYTTIWGNVPYWLISYKSNKSMSLKHFAYEPDFFIEEHLYRELYNSFDEIDINKHIGTNHVKIFDFCVISDNVEQPIELTYWEEVTIEGNTHSQKYFITKLPYSNNNKNEEQDSTTHKLYNEHIDRCKKWGQSINRKQLIESKRLSKEKDFFILCIEYFIIPRKMAIKPFSTSLILHD